MNRVTFDFTDTAVLVTGGTSGIGHAIATAFADAGARVTVTGRKPTPAGYDTDLARFAAGNAGVPYVWQFRGERAGPHLTVQALTHGNEVCGATAPGRLGH